MSQSLRVSLFNKSCSFRSSWVRGFQSLSLRYPSVHALQTSVTPPNVLTSSTSPFRFNDRYFSSAVSTEKPAGTSGTPQQPPATGSATLSRWRKLLLARRAAPPPKRRSNYVFDQRKLYSIEEALHHVRASAWAHFDETLELIFRLGIDPRRADHNIRGLISLPHGTGSSRPIAAFAYPGPAAEQAKTAGAALVGDHDLIQQILDSKGKVLKGFAGTVATPELMSVLAAKVGRILGPKGLMPNPKFGTVTGTLDDAIAKLQSGCVFRTDRAGTVQLRAGKLSFPDQHLVDNCIALTRGILMSRPSTVKKKYISAIFICSAMGPSVKVAIDSLTENAVKSLSNIDNVFST